MRILKNTLIILLLTFIISCSKDENTPASENPALNVYRIKQVIFPSTTTMDYEYNAQNKVSKIAYTTGIFEKYTYNSQGSILTYEASGYVSISQNSITNYVYDSSGVKIEEITVRGNGNKYKFVYTNNNGLPIEFKNYTWNTTTNLWVESTGSRLTYIYNSNNQVTRTQADSYYVLNAYDSRGNSNEYKLYNKKSDGTYFLSNQVNYTYDDKKAINYGPFTNGNKNNITDYLSKTYLENGSLSDQSSGSYSYEYNEASYVTKQYYNGALNATFSLDKIN